jgi:hypothetical protein
MAQDPYPWSNAQFDQGMAHNLVRMASHAVDSEVRKPTPVSRVRNPDGSEQGETAAEFTARLTETAVLYLLEMGLLVIPEDIGERLEQFFPLERQV